MAVHPQEASFIKVSAAPSNPIQAEFLNQFFPGEDLLLSPIIPAKTHNKVNQGFRQKTVTNIVQDIFRPITFAQLLLAIGPEDMWCRGHNRWCEPQCFIEIEIIWQAGDEFLTADD